MTAQKALMLNYYKINLTDLNLLNAIALKALMINYYYIHQNELKFVNCDSSEGTDVKLLLNKCK